MSTGQRRTTRAAVERAGNRPVDGTPDADQ